MQVAIRLFASLRERAGTDQVELELREGAVVGDALEQIHDLTAGAAVVMAVNRQYAQAQDVLHAGDEVALIPPVSGGSTGSLHVRIGTEPLTLDSLLASVRHPSAGAVVTFLGVTREVPQLDYEAYFEMAHPMIVEIASAAIEQHGLCSAAVEHRVGTVPLSEASLAVAVSAAHRAQAFAGASEIIDEIKARAPIWKKEDGEWVRGATPA